MSTRILRRAVALGAGAALTAGLGLVALTPANAAVIGTVSLSPGNGGIDTLINVSTAGGPQNGGCPATSTRVRAIAEGFGFPAGGQIILAPTAVGFSTTGSMSLPLSNSFRVYAQNNGNTPLVGAYAIRVQCTNNLGTTIIDEFTTTMNWTTPGNSFANIDNATYEARPSTTTTLTTSLTSPQTEAVLGAGVTLNLSATVDGGATDPSSGSVQFFRGATSLGTATVGAGGTATLTNVTLPSGSSTLSAVFAATPSFQGSTSADVTFQVNAAPATATTTTLAPIATPVEQGQPVAFNVTVTPNNAAGTVEFLRGATVIGTEPLASGTATFSTTSLPTGSNVLKARFVPTSPALFAGSESAEQTVVVNPPAVGFNQQLVNIDVPAGQLTISVDGDRTVTLPAALNANATRFIAAGSMDDVRVADTRAGSPGWVASGVLSQFKQGATDTIYAGNLGWTPSVTTVNAGQTVNAGAAVAPADGAAIATAAGQGLSVSRTLATSPAGASTGTAVLDANLSLVAPTTTGPGVHTAVLTFTAI